MERFLSAVSRPLPFHDVQEAWEPIDIAELDCTRMLTTLRSFFKIKLVILARQHGMLVTASFYTAEPSCEDVGGLT